jgi:hypothetical protein
MPPPGGGKAPQPTSQVKNSAIKKLINTLGSFTGWTRHTMTCFCHSVVARCVTMLNRMLPRVSAQHPAPG